MFLSTVKVADNRVAKYAEYPTEKEAQDHCDTYGGIVYEGEYSPELYIEDSVVTRVPLPDTTDYDLLRSEAYRNESDPIFFKWQRGEATEQEWLDKVAEIKLRFLKP
jgi:hypothetical protein